MLSQLIRRMKLNYLSNSNRRDSCPAAVIFDAKSEYGVKDLIGETTCPYTFGYTDPLYVFVNSRTNVVPENLVTRSSTEASIISYDEENDKIAHIARELIRIYNPNPYLADTGEGVSLEKLTKGVEDEAEYQCVLDNLSRGFGVLVTVTFDWRNGCPSSDVPKIKFTFEAENRETYIELVAGRGNEKSEAYRGVADFLLFAIDRAEKNAAGISYTADHRIAGTLTGAKQKIYEHILKEK